MDLARRSQSGFRHSIVIGLAAAILMCSVADTRARQPKARDGKPDLSGIWRVASDEYRIDLAADSTGVALQPWAAALYKERQANKGRERPSDRCLPRGVPGAMLRRDRPWKIVQTPGVILILYDDLLHYRQIFLDDRGFPDDLAPAWYGYSVARWDGDTLVVETRGINDETWLDDGGHPHSEALRVTERFRRRTAGTMDIEITIDDAKAYARPWTAAVRVNRLPDADLGEHVCPVAPAP
jgi:hypothetical protein